MTMARDFDGYSMDDLEAVIEVGRKANALIGTPAWEDFEKHMLASIGHHEVALQSFDIDDRGFRQEQGVIFGLRQAAMWPRYAIEDMKAASAEVDRRAREAQQLQDAVGH